MWDVLVYHLIQTYNRVHDALERVVVDTNFVLGYFADLADRFINKLIYISQDPMAKMVAVFLILWLVVTLL